MLTKTKKRKTLQTLQTLKAAKNLAGNHEIIRDAKQNTLLPNRHQVSCSFQLLLELELLVNKLTHKWHQNKFCRHTIIQLLRQSLKSAPPDQTRKNLSYRPCGRGWSPLFSPLIPGGPAPSGRWPVAWCRAHTWSYMRRASAWSLHASSRTCGRSHRCRRWWRSSPPGRWRWRTCGLQKEGELKCIIKLFFQINRTFRALLWYDSSKLFQARILNS